MRKKIKVIQDYYLHNIIKIMIFVIINISNKQIIKQIKAIPWDNIFIDFKTNNIYINNNLLIAQIENMFFSSEKLN